MLLDVNLLALTLKIPLVTVSPVVKATGADVPTCLVHVTVTPLARVADGTPPLSVVAIKD